MQNTPLPPNASSSQAQSSKNRRRWLRLSLGLFFSGSIIFWLGTTVDWRQVWPALNRVDYIWAGGGAATVCLNLGARALRWRALLDSPRVTVPATLQALALGQVLNLILPARLGDWGRAYLVAHWGYNSQVQALGTILLEKFWDIAALIVLLLLLSFWRALPPWIAIPARATAVAGGALLGAMLGFLWLRRYPLAEIASRWVGTNFLLWLERIVGRLLAGLAGLRRPRILLVAWLWTILVWFFGALTNLFLLKAFDLPFSIGVACLLLAVLHLGAAVPAVPGQVGVFEGLCVATLTLFGVRAGPALAYGVVLHLIILLPPLIMGLWGLLRLDADVRRFVTRPGAHFKIWAKKGIGG